MALSGTLETFTIPDVLRLLASTKKSGRLAVEGDRGAGEVWVDDGEIVAAASAVAADVEGSVFALLRFQEGSFAFEPGVPADEPGDARDVEDVLAAAEALLEEWREIEQVVPSLDVHVRLADAIDTDVTVTPAQWQLVSRIGSGQGGRAVAAALELGELDACRELASLVEAGLASVEAREPGEDLPEAARTLTDFEPPPFAADLVSDTEDEPVGTDADAFDLAGDDLAGHDLAGEDTAWDVGDSWQRHDPTEDATVEDPAVEDPAVDDPAVEDPAVEDPAVEDPAAEEDDEFLSQLSNLSPKAAAAISATQERSEADDGEIPPAEISEDALDGIFDVAEEPDEVEDTDEDVDENNLLLRFLSTTNQ